MSLSIPRTCSSAGCKLDAACSSQFVDSSLGEWSRSDYDDMTVERGTVVAVVFGLALPG